MEYRKYLEAGGSLTCYICNLPILFPTTPILGEVTIDHIIPKVKGGHTNMDNLRPTHMKCNSHKGEAVEYVPTLKHRLRIEAVKRLLDKTEKVQ